MRLRQQNSSRHAAGLTFIGREFHPCVINQRQARSRSLVPAKLGDGIGIEHVALVACALVKIGSQVQSVHVA